MNLVDFNKWKASQEKQYECIYSKQNENISSQKKISYYICHRSGSPKLVSEETRKRVMRRQGSCKMDSACSSTIKLIENKLLNSIEATIWTPHTHNQSLRFVNLSKDERSLIAGKLSMGVSFQKILDDIRDSSSNIERMSLLNRKDLQNIEKEFCIHKSMYLHQNDAVSVSLWINNMCNKLGDESPVIYYKLQSTVAENNMFKEDDIVLILMTQYQIELLKKFGTNIICIDSTHGTNSYDFLLSTLVVVDEYGEGIPVAYLISNKTDTFVMAHFFEIIKTKTGSITPKVFMSDDDAVFYNAWVSVMGLPLHRLLCDWHVDQNWRKQLKKINGSQEVKAEVYKCLRLLMDNTSVNEFSNLLENTLNELHNNDTTKEFANYFQNNYVNRVESWAHCYRYGLGINTNMYLEAFHKVLKHIYLEGKKVKRLDKTIDALMKFTRDKLFDRLTKTIKGKSTYRITLINKSHIESRSIKRENITQSKIDPSIWEVKSSSGKINYFIRKECAECPVENCQLRCNNCRSCIHIYSCSCPNYHIKFTICKHIHAVLSHIKSEHLDPSTSTTIEDSSTLPSCTIDHNITELRKIQDNQNAVDRIIEKMTLLQGQLLRTNHIDCNLLQTLEKTLDNTIQSVVSRAFIQSDETVKEPANKCIAPQIRFTSTKKRRINPCSQKTLCKANEAETTYYKELLMGSASSTTSKEVSSEHSYCQKPVLFK
ncbi:uncharacterized protein [Diabrotica undecimpunctata]|uniref:uncharacterized protein n=1 Tax=Diabrotica undecimpunctata TaxID=50387 RepID=UPI003B64190D